METHLMLVDREELFLELRQVFDVRTTEALLNVLNKVAKQVTAAGVPREDFSELKAIVAELAESQRRLETQMKELIATQQQAAEQIRDLAESHHKMEIKVAKLEGRTLEMAYREKTPAYFGKLLRRPKVISINQLWDALETHLSEVEINDLLLIDLIVQGKPRQQPERGDLWLAVEVSAVVDQEDVERARRRADLLRRAGYAAIPVAAGEAATLGAEAAAREQSVAVIQDGRSFLWPEAFAKWSGLV